MIVYRKLKPEDMDIRLFQEFQRRQAVTHCWQKENGKWMVKENPFVDDWSREDYAELVRCLRHTLATGGWVCGAFLSSPEEARGVLKGFVSVEGIPLGNRRQYGDLSSLHVSREMRGRGIGRRLFTRAVEFAGTLGVEKLYISSHPAVETQAFYRAMGCVEAQEYQPEQGEREPQDYPLEYVLSR